MTWIGSLPTWRTRAPLATRPSARPPKSRDARLRRQLARERAAVERHSVHLRAVLGRIQSKHRDAAIGRNGHTRCRGRHCGQVAHLIRRQRSVNTGELCAQRADRRRRLVAARRTRALRRGSHSRDGGHLAREGRVDGVNGVIAASKNTLAKRSPARRVEVGGSRESVPEVPDAGVTANPDATANADATSAIAGRMSKARMAGLSQCMTS